MPAAFDRAIKAGAKVRTKKLSGNRYIHLAKLDGKWTAGEVHAKKSGPSGKSPKKGKGPPKKTARKLMMMSD